MSRIGRTIGSNDANSDGSSDSGRSMALMPSSGAAALAQLDGGQLVEHLDPPQASMTGTRPTTSPTHSDRPMSTPRLSTMASGPGCGTVSEWVITPPEQIAMT